MAPTAIHGVYARMTRSAYLRGKAAKPKQCIGAKVKLMAMKKTPRISLRSNTSKNKKIAVKIMRMIAMDRM